MDAIIELPLPQAEQRFNFIARRSIDLFSAFLISENRTALESYLPHAHRQCGSETTSLGQDMNLSYLAGHISVASAPHNVDSSLVHEYDCYINDIHFNVADCISRLVSCSEGWSLRDVSKILTNIRSEVLGTERCDFLQIFLPCAPVFRYMIWIWFSSVADRSHLIFTIRSTIQLHSHNLHMDARDWTKEGGDLHQLRHWAFTLMIYHSYRFSLVAQNRILFGMRYCDLSIIILHLFHSDFVELCAVFPHSQIAKLTTAHGRLLWNFSIYFYSYWACF